MRKCVSEFVNALVKIHEVPPWYAVGSADNHRRRITEGIIGLNEGMRKCALRMRFSLDLINFSGADSLH